MTTLDHNGLPHARPTQGPESISTARMEALAFQWGSKIELHGDLAYLKHDGLEYVAVLDGWVA